MSQNKKRRNNAEPVEKSTSLQGLRIQNITPKTQAQQDVFDAFNEGYHLFLHGVAGTGKTFISLYLALKTILTSKEYKKIVIIRSAVPSRDIGFLPGTAKEKMMMYEMPYQVICNTLFQRGDAYDILKGKGTIEFVSTSFLRGITLNDAIVIADEAQNYTFAEADTLISRVGPNCKIIFCGDIDQTDLIKSRNDLTGLPKFMNIIDNMEIFDFIEFQTDDIVRSSLVKDYIIQKKKLGYGSAFEG
jgi:phosphate starvation-inducible protein PhoH